MKLLQSVLFDLKSWEQIKLNRWHLHAPIALIIGVCLMFFMFEILHGTGVFFSIFAPSFLGGCGLWLFELAQQGKRIIGEKERFESNKDLFLGWAFLVFGVLAMFLYLC